MQRFSRILLRERILSGLFQSGIFAFAESRPIVQGAFALRFGAAGFLAFGHHPHVVRGIVGQVAWLFVTWFVYLVNGISDVDGDRANHSQRPLATGRLTTRSASVWSAIVFLGSLLIACALGLEFFLSVVLMLGLGWFYSMGPRPLKEATWSSSLTVGLAGFLTYICGALAYGNGLSSPVLVMAGVMALWMAVAGNSKDFGDEEGDAMAGRKSLSVLLGRQRAATIVSIACGVVGALGVLAAMTTEVLAPLSLLLPIALSMGLVWSRTAFGDRKGRRLPYRLFMLSQYAVNALTILVLGVSIVWFGG